MGTIDLRGDGVNTEMETGSRSTAAPIVAHRASWSEKFRGTPLTEANQAIQAYAWTVGQLSVAKLPHSPTTQPQPDISFATESGHLHLLLTRASARSGCFSIMNLMKVRLWIERSDRFHGDIGGSRAPKLAEEISQAALGPGSQRSRTRHGGRLVGCRCRRRHACQYPIRVV